MRKDQFESPDYYMVEKLFSEEQIIVRDATRQWVKEYVSPIIEDYNLKNCLHLKSGFSLIFFSGFF